jgi:hypothetical protein
MPWAAAAASRPTIRKFPEINLLLTGLEKDSGYLDALGRIQVSTIFESALPARRDSRGIRHVGAGKRDNPEVS